jgi:hypothetical protein
MDKDFKTIVIVWLSVLTLACVCVVIFWQPICKCAARTVLKATMEAATSEVIHYRPPSRRQSARTESVEDFKAWMESVAPSETHDEALDRIDRERRALESDW